MKSVKHVRPPLEHILTKERIMVVEETPFEKVYVDGHPKTADFRMQKYVELVNSICGGARKIRDVNHDLWLPDPRRTYSVSEIADHLAEMGVTRFKIRHNPRVKRERNVR